MSFKTIFLALLFVIAIPLGAWPMFMAPDDTVPVDRLIASLDQRLAVAPTNADLHGQLARAHSLKYALAVHQVDVFGQSEEHSSLYEKCPPFLSDPTLPVEKMGEGRFQSLLRAIDHYRKAVSLDPKQPTYFLGLGYTLQQASKNADRIMALEGVDVEDEAIAGREKTFEDEALEAYREAFDLSKDSRFDVCRPIAEEAGSAILSIIEKRDISDPELAREYKYIKRKIIDIGSVPGAITPIVFSFSRERSFKSMITIEHTVEFDLDGLGKRLWPWVSSDTYFLVWDGAGTGNITSGRQFIGSVTWWLFWRNGYEVLSALDDNRDGWLGGAEMKGLAAWQDRNSNGVSDLGEVQSLDALGIVRLGTAISGMVENMPYCARGVQCRDGSFLPTYDWIAQPVTPGD